MWSPTHVQLTVGRCKNLVKKGKQGTNDAYVLIKCGSSKFQTSVKERTVEPQWYEKCEFALRDDPKLIKVKVYHRNFLGSDTLLGHVNLSLDKIELPISQQKKDWYRLQHKDPIKNASKYFGEIELILSLEVQSFLAISRTDLKKDLPQPIRSAAKTIGSMLRLKSYTSESTCSGSGKSDFFLRSKSYMDVSEMRGSNFTASHDKMVFQIDEEDEGSPPLSFDDEVKVQVELDDDECVNEVTDVVESNHKVDLPTIHLRPASDNYSASRSLNFADCGTKSEADLEKFWETLENSPIFSKGSERTQDALKSQNSLGCETHQDFFDSLLGKRATENKSTQTLDGNFSKMTTSATQTPYDETCPKCEEKSTENEVYLSQKQELLKLLNKQKSELKSSERRIQELEEYIDNMLARVLETQPQLLSSGVLFFNSLEKRKPTPIVEGFMSESKIDGNK